jgi:hypothetical protein
LLAGWWYFSPNYSELLSTPLGKLTLGEILWHAGLLCLVPLVRATVSWLYEAWTGRDSVWFWHPV